MCRARREVTLCGVWGDVCGVLCDVRVWCGIAMQSEVRWCGGGVLCGVLCDVVSLCGVSVESEERGKVVCGGWGWRGVGARADSR